MFVGMWWSNRAMSNWRQADKHPKRDSSNGRMLVPKLFYQCDSSWFCFGLLSHSNQTYEADQNFPISSLIMGYISFQWQEYKCQGGLQKECKNRGWADFADFKQTLGKSHEISQPHNQLISPSTGIISLAWWGALSFGWNWIKNELYLFFNSFSRLSADSVLETFFFQCFNVSLILARLQLHAELYPQSVRL